MNRQYYEESAVPAPVYSDEELYDLIGVSDDRVLEERDSAMKKGLEYLGNLLNPEGEMDHAGSLE